ncbi:MAG: hypothetical protein PHP26_03930 [Syntrophomonas sp.]|jgi:hypothetical protein|uniref:hypothetical protein n=1 Tax=Syntrophomonas sp. TaxID=2053627 RepID=UPI00262C79D8|nr:hypothetical protein [Syntrophomonas sp.]MDD2510401.1 hypothetical protein [Syntrophomonas sp.]MDD3879125.1 hypothetical protein [Syntrophomonas sp.]MDD4625571.1 hypothetical protein [Syntrophomonas sp.]
MGKIAAVYSGSQWQYDLFYSGKYRPYFDTVIHACNLQKESLSNCDVLVVPRESNQEMLLLIKNEIIQFLDNGGTVISFGEVTRPWLPKCTWEDKNPRFMYDGKSRWDKGELDGKPYKMMIPKHPLFKGLEIEDLQWHFHGMFHAADNTDVLLKYGEEGDIIYLDAKNFKGRILATTLDPEVHAGYGVVKKTQKFLDNVLNWARTI